jgi:hypothetical protein
LPQARAMRSFGRTDRSAISRPWANARSKPTSSHQPSNRSTGIHGSVVRFIVVFIIGAWLARDNFAPDASVGKVFQPGGVFRVAPAQPPGGDFDMVSMQRDGNLA